MRARGLGVAAILGMVWLVGACAPAAQRSAAGGSSTEGLPSGTEPSALASAPAPEPAVTAPASQPKSASPKRASATKLEHQFSGLMRMAAIAKLPSGHAEGTAAGARFHYGVFQSPDSLRAFLDAAEVRTFPTVEWNHEVVAFVVLHAQTNALAVRGLEIDGARAMFDVDWHGIEPFYADSVPVALGIVRLGQVEKLEFRLGGEDKKFASSLGSVAVSSE